MAKIQIIAAMTMDGFLPKADESLMQWVMNDAKGFPYWHEQSVYRLMPHYPLLDLLAEKHSDKNQSDTYIAEISDKDLTPSRWNMYKTTSFSNGITRIIYRNSCILQ